ncbi:MAG: hypothetical protein ACOZIN_21695 [Myxococcota bacterium]
MFLCSCATARLTSPLPLTPADMGQRRVVVLEPFFESAPWELATRSEHVQVYGAYGVPQDVVVTQQVAQKPVYARVSSLSTEHRLVLAEVRRLRPSWEVLSTGTLGELSGPATLVRVVVGEVETVESNRALKNLACAFGVILPPLLLLQLQPVQETHRVHGWLTRYEGEASDFAARRLRYPSQPDFAVDTRGFTPLPRAFGLDLSFEEGVLGPQDAREEVLVQGFSQRLAAAVVAIVEEQR